MKLIAHFIAGHPQREQFPNGIELRAAAADPKRAELCEDCWLCVQPHYTASRWQFHDAAVWKLAYLMTESVGATPIRLKSQFDKYGIPLPAKFIERIEVKE